MTHRCRRKALMRLASQGLGEKVRELMRSRHILEDYPSFLDLLPNEEVPHLNVLCLVVIPWVLGHEEGSHVVPMKRHLGHAISKRVQQVLEKDDLSTAIGERHQLSVLRRARDCLEGLGRPHDGSPVKKNQAPRRRATSVNVIRKACVGEGAHRRSTVEETAGHRPQGIVVAEPEGLGGRSVVKTPHCHGDHFLAWAL